ncbi:MAG: Xaa-Pro aminopeptidase, partial [Bacteroidota bacterium]
MKSVMRKLALVLGVSLFCIPLDMSGQDIHHPLPSLREQAPIQQEWLKIRLERVLPELMRTHGVHMWVVP